MFRVRGLWFVVVGSRSNTAVGLGLRFTHIVRVALRKTRGVWGACPPMKHVLRCTSIGSSLCGLNRFAPTSAQLGRCSTLHWWASPPNPPNMSSQFVIDFLIDKAARHHFEQDVGKPKT